MMGRTLLRRLWDRLYLRIFGVKRVGVIKAVFDKGVLAHQFVIVEKEDGSETMIDVNKISGQLEEEIPVFMILDNPGFKYTTEISCPKCDIKPMPLDTKEVKCVSCGSRY